MSQNRTEISELGEFGLINHLTKNVDIEQPSTILGIGDDAAVLDHLNQQTVISTDMLVEGVHFDLMYTSLKHVGYKSIAVNLSDIYAMNATPTQVTVSIAISNRFSVEALEEIYEGILLCCKNYNVDLIGGDTTSSTSGLIISVTAIGTVQENKYITRSGAQSGDILCVSGDLGAAYLGLQILEREKKIFLENPQVQPDLENRIHVLGRLLKPEPRKDIVDWLAEKSLQPTAMIDVSDGLSSEILHICQQSQLGCVVYEEKIPIHQESKEVAYTFQIDPTMCAMNGGEDYELLFTIHPSAFEEIKFNENISVIGYLTEDSQKKTLITKGGKEHPLVAQGWKSF